MAQNFRFKSRIQASSAFKANPVRIMTVDSNLKRAVQDRHPLDGGTPALPGVDFLND
jgi:hypothetical protein